MTVTEPRISVIMTVHDGEHYLAEAIDSVLAQTMSALELLVVDDLSGDATPDILAAYAARDARVRVLRNPQNIGPYPSANEALAVARAPLVARMDADDVSEPDRLARQMEFLERHRQCLLVGSGYRSIDAEGAVRFTRRNPLDFELAAFVTRLRMPMVHPGFCFRRLHPDGTPVRYDTAFPIAGDYALAAALAREGKIASLDAALVRYRMHADNISTTKLDRQRHFAHEIACQEVRDHYPAPIAASLLPMLHALYRRGPAGPTELREAVRGIDAALKHDFGSRPPAQARQRAAGILAEAFLASGNTLSLLPSFGRHALHHLLPLAQRAAQLHNLLGSPSRTDPLPR